MSHPSPPYPRRDPGDRLAKLKANGRTVELSTVKDGEVVHTGFGYGAEFWLLPAGAAPWAAVIDIGTEEMPGARLIIDNDRPLSASDPLRARGLTVTHRILRL